MRRKKISNYHFLFSFIYLRFESKKREQERRRRKRVVNSTRCWNKSLYEFIKGGMLLIGRSADATMSSIKCLMFKKSPQHIRNHHIRYSSDFLYFFKTLAIYCVCVCVCEMKIETNYFFSAMKFMAFLRSDVTNKQKI